MNLQMNDKMLWIRRVFLICYDIVAVIAASFLALIVRFDFNVNSIPRDYYERMFEMFPVMVLFTIIIFWLFRLYSSLWSYVGAMELMYLTAACVVDTVVNILLVYLLYRNVPVPMPRSYYLLSGIFLLGLVFASRYGYRALRAMLRLRVDAGSRKNVMIVGDRKSVV